MFVDVQPHELTGTATVHLHNTLTGVSSDLSVPLSPDMVTPSTGDGMRLSAKQRIEWLQLHQPSDKSSVVELSVKYSVLSKHTSMLATHKNKDKCTEEMVSVRMEAQSHI